MAKKKKSAKEIAQSKRDRRKRIMTWNACWKEIGVCPLTDKITQADKDKARKCVERKTGKKAKKK